jgi:hypothetical protein
MKIIRNEELRGLEIYFDEKPQTEVLSTLKAEGFRWHRIKKCWYNKISDAVLKIAESLANGQVLTTTKATKAERQPKTAINKYGVKVGDIFYMSWGYEQTNLDFFVVVELVGSQSVRIKECVLKTTEESMYSHGMARDVAFDTSKFEILERSLFCKDDQKGKGMLKRVCQMGDSVFLNMTSYANAYPYKGKKLYNSWYA